MNSPVLRASSAARYAACPGSWAAELQIKLPEADSPDAAKGKLLHAELARYALAVQAMIDLPRLSDEAAILWGKMETAVYATGATEYKIDEVEAEWFRPGWSGHPDLVLTAGENVHIIDWKTGWGDVPDAADNAQVRTYAVLYPEPEALFPCPNGKIYCHVIPLQAEPSCAAFDDVALAAAVLELQAIHDDATSPGAERFPGSHCRYCRAQGTAICPESTAIIPAAEKILAEVVDLRAVEPAYISRVLEIMEGVRRLRRSVAWEAMESEAKRRLAADPAAIPGWGLEEGKKRRSVADTARALLRLTAFPDAVIYPALSVQLGELEKQLKKHTGKTKQEARDEVMTLLGDLIETSQDQPSIKRTAE